MPKQITRRQSSIKATTKAKVVPKEALCETEVEPVRKKETPKEEKPIPRCEFRPTRANQKSCNEEAATKWGFCTKHSRTIQAKEAKKRYDEMILEEQEKELKELDAELTKELEDIEEERVVVTPNAWGRFEDKESGILFDQETKNAYGLQGGDGLVYSLDEDAIKTCIENGWTYVLRSKPVTKETKGKVAPVTPPEDKPKILPKKAAPVEEEESEEKEAQAEEKTDDEETIPEESEEEESADDVEEEDSSE
jgi:hypothetical protein